MNIDKYKNVNGLYQINESSPEYDDPIDFIQQELFGFRGCGCPESNLKFIRDVMEILKWWHFYMKDKKFDDVYPEYQKRLKDLCSNEGALYLAYYVLHDKGFTEHGGSVPGWLTDNGEELLVDINELLPKENV